MEKLLGEYGFLRQELRFHSNLIIHKILNQVIIRLGINRNKLLLTLLYQSRFLLYPLTALADKVKGVSEFGIYRKIR